LTVTVAVASAVVTTAALTGLVELRDEGSSAPNVRHRRNDRDLHPRLRNRRHPRRIERPPPLQLAAPLLRKGACTMTKVVAIMSMSLDGYVAYANDGVAEVFDWYFSGDV
jgi:hypothetical protein